MNHQTKEPTKLDVERIVYQRTFSPSRDDYYKLKNLEAGVLGEQTVFNYLKKYGLDDWIVVRNIWLNHGGPFEADLILLTNHGPYLFEVKNYSSEFIFEKGVSSFNGQINSGNPINQTSRNTINLQNIWNRVNVRGFLVLVGVDNYVEINSEIPDIKVVKRNELKREIGKIVKREDDYRGRPNNKKYLLKQLEKHEIERYHGPKPLSKKQLSRLRKGIYCLNCKSFDVDIKRKTVECACNFTEERELAILRTICEYGVLTFDKDLKVGNLAKFFGNQVSRLSIRKVLTKYFVKISNGSHTFYVNRGLPLDKLYKELNIDSTVDISLSHQQYSHLKREIHQIETVTGKINQLPNQ